MFNKNKTPNLPPASAPKAEPYEIHVMPPKFHQYLKPAKKSGLGRFVVIFIMVFMVLAAMASGAYYLYTTLPKAQPITNTNTGPEINLNTNQPETNLNQTNENLNTIPNLNENLNSNVNANENLNAVGNENLNANLNLNGNLNANTNQLGIISYQGTLDSDGDGLTDVEEDVYTTEKRKPDTDGDGYLDGAEVSTDYNPKEGGGAILETSGLVNKYSNPLFSYDILYPKDFLAKPTDASMNEVIFQSSTEEYFSVSVEDNPDSLALVDWYVKQSPGTDLNLLERKTLKSGYQVLLSPDKLTYYLQVPAKPTQIFVINYNIGNLAEINFLTTFQMMINSFRLNTAPVTPAL